jgi:hypothetical protein
LDPCYGPPYKMFSCKMLIDTLQNYNGHLQDAGYAQICAGLLFNFQPLACQ